MEHMSPTKTPNLANQVLQIEAEISELSARLPMHSVPPAMLLHLEELEEQLADLKSQLGERSPTLAAH